ncbi:MAG: hypothetical protein J1F03_03605 [Oscillospiraceae bacterium]|nr:hypothetical protein [Oscillospiraceae bacterium]
MRDLTFGDIRKYVALTDGISICMRETLTYELFNYIWEVPDTYNELYLIGFGQLNEPFDNNGYKTHLALEIMLSHTPREDDK